VKGIAGGTAPAAIAEMERMAPGRDDAAAMAPFPAPCGGHVFSRYPVLNIHHTAIRQSTRNKKVMPTLTGTLMSEMP
jgi:hypothetical protein